MRCEKYSIVAKVETRVHDVFSSEMELTVFITEELVKKISLSFLFSVLSDQDQRDFSRKTKP